MPVGEQFAISFRRRSPCQTAWRRRPFPTWPAAGRSRRSVVFLDGFVDAAVEPRICGRTHRTLHLCVSVCSPAIWRDRAKSG